MTRTLMNRRTLLKGFAGLTVLAAGGTVYRAWDNGVFDVGGGPAYEPWHDWREAALEGPLALVQAAILASNAHNTQPWRFQVSGDHIAVFADHQRHLGAFDPFRREMALSLGCALENMVHAARAQGLEPRVELAPDRFAVGGPSNPGEAVATLHLSPGERVDGELFQVIANRHTHRGAYEAERPVSSTLQSEMQALLGGREDIRLLLYGEGPAKARLGEIAVAATEDIVADHEMAMDSARWFRFDWRSVQEHRDGVTLDTVGLPPLINAAAKIIPAPSAEQADRQWLEATRNVHVATAPLLGMIAVSDLYDQSTTLDAGRLWQRLHLWATARGLAAQPLNMPPERVDREAELGLEPRMAAALAQVTGDPAWKPTFVFRTGYAERQARLSPRRPLDAVVAA
jgi:nitroreductase